MGIRLSSGSRPRSLRSTPSESMKSSTPKGTNICTGLRSISASPVCFGRQRENDRVLSGILHHHDKGPRRSPRGRIAPDGERGPDTATEEVAMAPAQVWFGKKTPRGKPSLKQNSDLVLTLIFVDAQPTLTPFCSLPQLIPLNLPRSSLGQIFDELNLLGAFVGGQSGGHELS